MEVICKNVSELKSELAIEIMENKYNTKIPKILKEFFRKNNGGIPLKKEFTVGDTDYEIRCFLSFNDDDYNSIESSMKSFQEETKGKIIPFAKDSGDNYFCLNIETGKVYYWENEQNLYYNIAETFEGFIGYLIE